MFTHSKADSGYQTPHLSLPATRNLSLRPLTIIDHLGRFGCHTPRQLFSTADCCLSSYPISFLAPLDARLALIRRNQFLPHSPAIQPFFSVQHWCPSSHKTLIHPRHSRSHPSPNTCPFPVVDVSCLGWSSVIETHLSLPNCCTATIHNITYRRVASGTYCNIDRARRLVESRHTSRSSYFVRWVWRPSMSSCCCLTTMTTRRQPRMIHTHTKTGCKHPTTFLFRKRKKEYKRLFSALDHSRVTHHLLTTLEVFACIRLAEFTHMPTLSLLRYDSLHRDETTHPIYARLWIFFPSHLYYCSSRHLVVLVSWKDNQVFPTRNLTTSNHRNF